MSLFILNVLHFYHQTSYIYRVLEILLLGSGSDKLLSDKRRSFLAQDCIPSLSTVELITRLVWSIYLIAAMTDDEKSRGKCSRGKTISARLMYYS